MNGLTKRAAEAQGPTLSRRRMLAWSLAACAGLSRASGATGQAPIDVLHRPAVITPRAGASAMLAIARAANRLVAAGEHGIVLLSDDHGATWRQVAVPVGVSLTALQFVDAERGWAVGHGGTVLCTDDGGSSWTVQLDGVQAARLVQEAARALPDGGSESARKRLEAADRLVGDGPDKPLLDVHFTDRLNGFVVGAYGLAFRTQDGGQHWQPWIDRLPNARERHLYRIASAGKRMFIAGEQGLLLRSDDGGGSFSAVETPYAGTYFGVHAPADGGVLVYGLRGNAYAAADAAGPWSKVELHTPNAIVDGIVLSDARLLLVDQQGQAFVSPPPGRPEGLQRATLNFAAPVSSLVQAADGSFVAATLQGMRRLSVPARPVA